MADRLIGAGGMLLAAGVTAGTWLYVVGVAPPFPLNALAFGGLLFVSFLYALLFGRGHGDESGRA